MTFGLSDELERLNRLRDEGIISDDEFTLAKRRLLQPEAGRKSTADLNEPTDLSQGWKPDPNGRPDTEWYWDGTHWTGRRRRYDGPDADDFSYYEVRSPGNPVCDRCGGTVFNPKRRTSTKMAFGVLSLAGSPKHLECVRCGGMIKRG